jgi:hypothetical protein
VSDSGTPMTFLPTLLSTLPRLEWTWTPDGRRVQLWVWPKDHPLEMDVDVSDLATTEALAGGSAPHVVEALPLGTAVADETAVDEFALAALLAQYGGK